MEWLFVERVKNGWLEAAFVFLRVSVDESRSIRGASGEHAGRIKGGVTLFCL